MNAGYEDIKKRIKETPKWYDDNGVPRYDDFHPDLSPNIYSNHIGLFEIACQHCHQRFFVSISAGVFDRLNGLAPAKWHYGDPPIHGCVGDTMNCEDLRIVEFWTRKGTDDWKRREEFEGEIR